MLDLIIYGEAKGVKSVLLKKISKENNYQWREDRELLNLEYAFRQRSYKLVKMVLNYTGRIKKHTKSEILLGYTYKDLKNHITQHPDWEYLKDKKWHIDHIFPIKAFIDIGIFDICIVNNLDNLKPMLGIENCSKSCKYNKDDFIEWLKTKGIQVKDKVNA